ncbi:hypothetical protein ALQ72_100643 [Pseudomonas syringae pv. maculicola]|uniref:Uncharacterized protein n=1 Tax=Pseudomonas syringae pv. maculicola TaxID=59511 RepID=A0A3M3GAB7_PSEYM|nr:hypothetical protein ALQ72_100643 [Pseudomonas syringae pv. maculicola]RMV38943.1 hypothetical protein ALP13_103157 [Pseudomonas syringae pv. maculicola]
MRTRLASPRLGAHTPLQWAAVQFFTATATGTCDLMKCVDLSCTILQLRTTSTADNADSPDAAIAIN